MDGYQKIGSALVEIVGRCRGKYGKDWAEIKKRTLDELTKGSNDKRDVRSDALARAMIALDKGDHDAAMLYVGAAYDPEKNQSEKDQ